MLKDLTLEMSGMHDADNSGGGGGGETPPIMAPHQFNDEGALQSFSGAGLMTSASNAASTVGTAVSSAATTVTTKVASAATSVSTSIKNLFSGAPTGSAVATSSAAGGSSLTWLWVLLAALAAFLVYHFTKGKKGGKLFTSRAGGSHVKSYGK